MAVFTVALGLILALTGITGQLTHHMYAAVNPISVADSSQDTHPHGVQIFPSAAAATLPFLVTSYSTLNYALDGDGIAGPQIFKVTQEFHGRDCEFCMKIEYNPYIQGKAAFALTTFQPLEVENPERLILMARSEYGGEQVRFKLLGKPTTTTSSTLDSELFGNVDFVSRSETITLTTNFRTYHVDVPAVDAEQLDDVTHLVVVEIDAGNGVRPVVLYIDGLVYDEIEPDPKFIVEQAEEIASS